MSKVILEVCAGTVDEARMAFEEGADRIEFCCGLSVGGLTPTPGMMERVREVCPGLPIMAMVRSREGGFLYSEDEFEAMKRDARHLIQLGADGIVFGFLHADGSMDLPRMKALVELADGKETMMHRSFDSTPDLAGTVDQLIELGVTRALTSGGAGKAPLGAQKLRELQSRAGTSLEILPGGGILPENAAELVTVSGCSQLHFASRKEGPGSDGGVPEMIPDPEVVRGIRSAVMGLTW